MRDIGDDLRALANEPPPTTINIDTLIENEQRRSRMLRVGATAGGLAASVTAVVLGVGLVTGGMHLPTRESAAAGGSNTSGATLDDPSPEPTADVESGAPIPCDTVVLAPKGVYQSFTAVRSGPIPNPSDTARRLSTTLGTALGKLAPEAKMTDLTHDQKCAGKPLFIYDPQRREFSLTLKIEDSSGWGVLYLDIMPTETGWDRCYASPPQPDCDLKKLGDGSSYRAQASDLGDSSNREARQHLVRLFRTDDTTVMLTTSNFEIQRATNSSSASGGKSSSGKSGTARSGHSSSEADASAIGKQGEGDEGNGIDTKITRPTPLLSLEQMVELARAPGLGIY